MKNYKDMESLSGVEESRNILLSPVEIDICIRELEEEIEVQRKWLDSIDTKVKISNNKKCLISNGNIHDVVEKTEDFITHSLYRIKILKMERLQYLN